ncbi:SIK3 kinase, partial [Leucopsar rothschildi]|nr:SIK3 kinase [Leucopsar rothschildi]
MRLPQAEFAQLIKRRQQQQQQQEFQELFRHMSQGDAGNMGTSMGQNLSERQSLSLPYQSADTYHPQNSPQHLLKIRAQECIQQVPASVPPPQGYGHQPALFHSESMEEDCACEGNRDSFPDSKSSNTLTKGCHETPLLVNAGGHGDPESLLGTANPAQELGTHQYRHQPAPGFRNKVPSRESIVGNCMDRSSPGQAMQVPDHNGLGYPVRPSSSEQRPRSLQRHHTIQNSDDAYVQLDNLPGMSLMAGKALSSARMSDAVLSQSSLMASQQLRDRDSEECGESLEGQEHANLGDGSQHLNTSCYPSTCITDVLLSYKHPEVPFGMEQAGV